MAKRRRRSRRKRRPLRILLLSIAAVPLLYVLAALVGAVFPVNAAWTEPAAGQTIYFVSNGVHTDLILPAVAQGLDWRPLLPKDDFARTDAAAQWIAFGMGEKEVYLETPRWRDIRPRTIWAGLVGGQRVMHVEWVRDPAWQARAIRLRPEEYRRLWTAIRAGFVLGSDGRPKRIDHPGYGPDDAFYQGVGHASAINTCNVWTSDRLRIAGVRTSLWTPFAQGALWRYRKAQST